MVEQQVAVHEPGQVGGNFYQLFVLVKNGSEEVALGVSGQVSLKDGDGRLLQSANPNEVNILPGERALIIELANTSSVPAAVIVESTLEADTYREGGQSSPASFSDVRLEHDEFSGCAIRGTVSNRFSEAKENLQIRVAGLTAARSSQAAPPI